MAIYCSVVLTSKGTQRVVIKSILLNQQKRISLKCLVVFTATTHLLVGTFVIKDKKSVTYSSI